MYMFGNLVILSDLTKQFRQLFTEETLQNLCFEAQFLYINAASV